LLAQKSLTLTDLLFENDRDKSVIVGNKHLLFGAQISDITTVVFTNFVAYFFFKTIVFNLLVASAVCAANFLTSSAKQMAKPSTLLSARAASMAALVPVNLFAEEIASITSVIF